MLLLRVLIELTVAALMASATNVSETPGLLATGAALSPISLPLMLVTVVPAGIEVPVTFIPTKSPSATASLPAGKVTAARVVVKGTAATKVLAGGVLVVYKL
jgi:hypothetical protein